MANGLTRLQRRLLSQVEGYIDVSKEAFVGLSFSPVTKLARSAIVALLHQINIGRLMLVEGTDSQTLFGQEQGNPSTCLHVINSAFWLRVLLNGDMGFAESYMAGDFTCSDMTSFFEIFIANREELGNATTIFSSVFSVLNAVLNSRLANSVHYAISNIAAHYDISNDMFEAFLSRDMTYSAAIFDQNDAKDTLEKAQYRKLDSIIQKACLKPSDHILEIGCGWGSFAIRAAQKSRCQVTSLTLSIEQKELAEERVAAAGVADRVRVLLCDYRELVAPPGGFDKVVSIEMIEAVGREYLQLYFSVVNRLLKHNGGIAVFQTITMPETRHETYTKSPDFIRRYIFPGGYLSTVTELVAKLHAGSQGQLIVDAIQNIGPHYAKTLRLWRQAFNDNFDSSIAPALLRRSAKVTMKDVATFKRKWEYYFAYCEAGFKTKTLGNVILTVAREGATELMQDVPL